MPQANGYALKHNDMNIKNFTMVIAAAAIATGSLAFKAVERNFATTLWYQVNLDEDDPNDASKQLIDANSGTSSTPSFPCIEDNGLICAVELTLGTGSSVPANMQDAITRQATDSTDVKIEDQSHRQD